MIFYKNRKGVPFECWLKFYGEVQRVEDAAVSDMNNFEDSFAPYGYVS